MRTNYIFLGMVAIKYHPKREANQFVEYMHKAGIRFVLFSNEDFIDTKAFGSQLGLETDWNSCISLSNSPKISNKMRMFNEGGQCVLPVGMKEVKSHLKNVDDVPMQLSLFCQCYPEVIYEMMKCYQQYQEIVICVGSGLRMSNILNYQEASISFAVRVEMQSMCKKCNGLRKEENKSSNIIRDLSLELNTIPCMKTLPCNSSLFCFYALCQESRKIVLNQELILKYLYISALSMIIYESLHYFSPLEERTELKNIFSCIVMYLVCKFNLWNKEDDNFLMRTLPKRRKCTKFLMSHKIHMNSLTFIAILEGICFRTISALLNNNPSLLTHIICSLLANWLTCYYIDKVFVLNIRTIVFLCVLIASELVYGIILNSAVLINRLIYYMCWLLGIPIVMFLKVRISKANLSDQTILRMFFNTKLGMHSPK